MATNLVTVKEIAKTGILFCLLICFCCKSPNKKDLSKPVQRKEDKSSGTKVGSKVINLSCVDFLKFLYKDKNLTHYRERSDFSPMSFYLRDSLHILTSKATIRQHNFVYKIFSKASPPPILSYFRKQDYLGAEISVDGKTFSLDKTPIQPSEIYKGATIDFPLTLSERGGYGYFRFQNKEYIVLQAYPPCNGSYCQKNFLLFFEFSSSKINMFLISSFEYHPFLFSNTFFGDKDGDKVLDFFCVFEVEQRSLYEIRAYSFAETDVVPIKKHDGSNVYLRYSCERCSGVMTDTLTITEANWW
jgi:hypothetical protein